MREIFEKRVHRKLFGPEKDEVSGMLHNEELCYLYMPHI
jgi:hypothetical protein